MRRTKSTAPALRDRHRLYGGTGCGKVSDGEGGGVGIKRIGTYPISILTTRSPFPVLSDNPIDQPAAVEVGGLGMEESGEKQ